jgi:hypothetical protein
MKKPGSTANNIRRVSRLFSWLAVLSYAGIGIFCVVSQKYFQSAGMAQLLGIACLFMAGFRGIRLWNKQKETPNEM